jgi:hypothetical protein
MKHALIASLVLAMSMVAGTVQADSQKLRIISWADYVPADLIAAFKKETGIDVELTLSNNEEMISKLRATGGAGYDLAQPSQDRILAAQREFGIYKPLDLTKVKTARCTRCPICGERTAWWSTPSAPGLPTILICAGRISRARQPFVCGARR